MQTESGSAFAGSLVQAPQVNIITTIHENMGYWDGRVNASKGRKVEASDDAYFHGYRLGLTGGPAPNEFTNWVSPPELHEE